MHGASDCWCYCRGIDTVCPRRAIRCPVRRRRGRGHARILVISQFAHSAGSVSVRAGTGRRAASCGDGVARRPTRRPIRVAVETKGAILAAWVPAEEPAGTLRAPLGWQAAHRQAGRSSGPRGDGGSAARAAFAWERSPRTRKAHQANTGAGQERPGWEISRREFGTRARHAQDLGWFDNRSATITLND
jgi:hypothetical protein